LKFNYRFFQPEGQLGFGAITFFVTLPLTQVSV
jgi:hypothetical protein